MIKNRAYSNRDYDAVIEFLNKVYKLNKNQHSWLPARWEYAEYFVSPLFVIVQEKENWTSSMRLWINEEDFKIVGIVNSEDPNEQAFMQIHPEYRHIEDEMIQWAEDNIAQEVKENEGKKIVVYAHDGDEHREEILKSRGYEKSDEFEHLKWQELDKEIGDVPLAEGYSILSFAEEDNLEGKIKCIVKGFNPHLENITPDAEDIMIYKSIQSAPMYRPDLDLYAKHEDGTITTSVLFWYHPELKVGMIEPVATHTDHQRKGLSRAVITEGLKRLKAMGAERAYVGARGYRSKVYSSAGFEEYDVYREWVKFIK